MVTNGTLLDTEIVRRPRRVTTTVTEVLLAGVVTAVRTVVAVFEGLLVDVVEAPSGDHVVAVAVE